MFCRQLACCFELRCLDVPIPFFHRLSFAGRKGQPHLSFYCWFLTSSSIITKVKKLPEINTQPEEVLFNSSQMGRVSPRYLGMQEATIGNLQNIYRFRNKRTE